MGYNRDAEYKENIYKYTIDFRFLSGAFILDRTHLQYIPLKATIKSVRRILLHEVTVPLPSTNLRLAQRQLNQLPRAGCRLPLQLPHPRYRNERGEQQGGRFRH